MKENTKNDMFFRHRFGIDFGGVWGSILDPKNVDFLYFQVRSSHVKAGQGRSSQVRSGQVNSRQVRASTLQATRGEGVAPSYKDGTALEYPSFSKDGTALLRRSRASPGHV